MSIAFTNPSFASANATPFTIAALPEDNRQTGLRASDLLNKLLNKARILFSSERGYFDRNEREQYLADAAVLKARYSMRMYP